MTLSVEQSGAAEELTESLNAIAGVRDVVFAQDGTPTVIVDPNAASLDIGYATLTSCVSDEDIAAAQAAAESLHLAADEPLVIGYEPFSDCILIATNLDEAKVRAAMPPYLTERQLAIEPLGATERMTDRSTEASA